MLLSDLVALRPLQPRQPWGFLVLALAVLGVLSVLSAVLPRASQNLLRHKDLLVPLGLYLAAQGALHRLVMMPGLASVLTPAWPLRVAALSFSVSLALVLQVVLAILYPGWVTVLILQAIRWLELKGVLQRDDREETMITKLLLPEKYLKKGESPQAHLVKGWAKGGTEPRKLTDPSQTRGPEPAFLCGPLKEAQTLEAEVVDGPFGKLSCEGVTGYTEFKQGGNDFKVTFETRLHEKAPFGVVTSRMKYERSRDGQAEQSGTVTMTLAEVGTDAKTELPDCQ